MREDPPAHAPSPLSPRWEWIYLATSIGMIVGLFIDGWSHSHITSRATESALTPWHVPLYAGSIACALVIFRIVERYRIPGAGWRGTAPRGYGLAVVATFLYPVGAALDLIWHAVFGVEGGVEALISPTHVVVISCMGVMVGTAFRSWAQADPVATAGDRWATWRAVTSMTFVLLTVLFSTTYADPLTKLFGAPGTEQDVAAGLTGFLFISVIVSAVIAALLQPRRPLPTGSFTLLYAGAGIGIGFLSGAVAFTVTVCLAAGLATDAGLVLMRRRGWLDEYAFLLAPLSVAVLWTAYFALLAVRHGVAWIIHVWVGAIVLSALVALLISLLALGRASRAGATPEAGTPAGSGTPRSRR